MAVVVATATAMLLAACSPASDPTPEPTPEAIVTSTPTPVPIVATVPDDELLFPGALLICSDLPYPPQEFFDEQGRPIGSDIEIGEEIALRLGLEARIVNSVFDTIIDARENGTGPRLGIIQFLNETLTGIKHQVSPDHPGLFTDAQGVLYAHYGIQSGEGTLFITKPGEAGGLTIRSFRSGDFGFAQTHVIPPDRAGDAVLWLRAGVIECVAVDAAGAQRQAQ